MRNCSPARSVSPSSITELSFRARLTLAACTLVLLTGAVVTWLAHRSAKASMTVREHVLAGAWRVQRSDKLEALRRETIAAHHAR